ncbi:MAG: hypothetical protein ACJ8HI_20270 [Massilia sp.]
MPRFKCSPAHRALLLAILIAALLCAHWQGLAHRIGHASRMLGMADAALVVQAGASALPDTEQAAGHSCLAFDAACVGAFLATTPFQLAVRRNTAVTAAWIAFLSYLAPFTVHFSSRAPPRA